MTLLIAPPAVGFVALSGGTTLALRVLAVASLVGGTVIFMGHGGPRLTAAGTYCLTAGLMAGCGAWYWAGQAPPTTSQESILLAGLTVYLSTAAMYLLFWRRHVVAPADVLPGRTEPISIRDARSLRALGALLFMIGAGAQQADLAVGGMAVSAADVGVLLFAASLLLGGGIRVLQSPFRTLTVGAVLIAYYVIVFAGEGRLRLATLVIATAIIAQYRLQTRIKGLALLALLPTLVLFASIGQERVAATTPNLEASASGLGSLVNPLATVGQLLNERITGGQGSTFLAQFVLVVPRELWPEKPIQFGRVLALELRPQSIATNLSLPSLPQGEWYYNFSWLGILLMIPVLGLAIRWIDTRLAANSLKYLTDHNRIFVFLVLAILAGSIGDLAWGGTATWANRNIQRLLVLLPFLLWSYIMSRSQRAENSMQVTTPASTHR